MHAAAVLIFILAALLFSYLYIIRPWHLHWGATHLDRIAVLPGDALVTFEQDATDALGPAPHRAS